MRRLRSSPYQSATLATAVLGGVLLGQALDTSVTAYAVINAAAGAVAGLAAARMATRDSFDDRLAAGMVCAVSGMVALLAMVVGIPGNTTSHVTLPGATLVACGVLVPLLLVRHHRSGLVRDDAARPYAP